MTADSAMVEKKSGFRRRLPEDIETEMLLLLPVKTLKRFQFACKLWYLLIYSHEFQNAYLRRAQADALLLTLQSETNLFEEWFDQDLTLHFAVYKNNDGAPVKMFSKQIIKPYFNSGRENNLSVQSCHGLVSISITQQPILICNPTTEEIMSLPPAPLTLSSDNCFGFGHTTSTDEYKVVRFYCDREGSCCDVLILGTDHWRKAKTPPFKVFQGTAPFLHGALHLLHVVDDNEHVGSQCGDLDDADYLTIFDIETEDYKHILLPKCYHSLVKWEGIFSGPRNHMRLSKLGGELCLTFDFSGSKQRLEVWILKDYFHGEWVKGHDIDVSSLYTYTPLYLQCYPLDSMDDETILLNSADIRGIKLLSFNTKDGTPSLKKVREWGASIYSESFYHLKDASLPVEELSDYKDADSDDADKNDDPGGADADADEKDEEEDEDEDDFLRPPTKKNRR